jgi:class 3 adenylate cyclase
MSGLAGGAGSEGPRGRSESLTHGFLFADLRGFTSYLDRRGATAAAAMLARFRELVRRAVAAHRGAEIRTEGDSFYVVFPSASAAVACALELVRAAAEEAETSGDPIRIGVGVHAGEAVETPEGPVGSAVNIAARLCAVAGPGDVVASDTVRALTRSVGEAAFVSLGRRRLKGLDEPLALYRAVPAGAPVAGRRIRMRRGPATWRLAIAVVGVVLALAIGSVVASRLAGPGSGPSASTAAMASSSGLVTPSVSASASQRPAGFFRADAFALPFEIVLGDGWVKQAQQTDLVVFAHPEEPSGQLDVIAVTAVLEPPCLRSEPRSIGSRPEDLIDWLTSRGWLDHGTAQPINVGPYLGWAVDIEVGPGDRWECDGAPGLRRAEMFRLGVVDFRRSWGAEIGERRRMVVLDVERRTVAMSLGSSFPDVEKLWYLYSPRLQTIRFDADRR